MSAEVYEVAYKSKAQIQQFARYARDKLKIKGFYADVVKLVEVQFPLFIPNYVFQVLDDDATEMSGTLAFTEVKNGKLTMYVRESIYEEALEDKGRARFTLAHEAGHVFMHCTEDISLKRVECYDQLRVPIKNERNPEWQADQFAAEFLAPTHMIKGMTLNEIMWNFKVSRSCAMNCRIAK